MNRTSQSPPVPTVDDLRVKLCYICREEELYSAPPEDPPRAWTHPCSCTLVAHESCLLRWIQTSQGDSARAPNALKCPQCGTRYELVSHRPRILRLLGAGNGLLQRAGRLATLFGAAGVVAVFASGIYVVLTAYGAWALKQFLGKEMYDLLITNNTSNWHWTTLVNLPSIPLSLIISRFQSFQPIPSLIPVLLVWPPSPPIINSSSQLLSLQHTNPDTDIRYPPNTAPIPHNHNERWAWPPTPAMFGLFVLPVVRALYRRLWAKVQVWVLGAQPPSARITHAAATAAAAGIMWDGWPVIIRIRANVREEDGPQGQGQGQRQPGQQQQQRQPGAPAQQVPQGQQANQVNQANAAPAPAALPENAEEAEAEADQALAAAEQQISISASSLGRRVGGALLIPYISSRMGALLLSLSKRSHILRRILGVRPPLAAAGVASWPYTYIAGYPVVGNGFEGVRKIVGAVWKASWTGSRMWIEADPVWWRNALGLGLFVVAKDTIELLHLWLTLRELETRHVKNRDFSGVDVRELDLVPGFFSRS